MLFHDRSADISVNGVRTAWCFCIGLVLLALHPVGPPFAFSAGEPRPEMRVTAGTFLVASPDMKDPRFLQAVILMVRHDLKGSAGIVINRPSELTLAHLFPEYGKKLGSGQFVFQGGPLAMEKMVCLMQLQKSIAVVKRVFGSVYITSSRRVIEQVVAQSSSNNRFRVYAGYAGWARGQLAAEVAHGQWKVIEADAKTIFETPADEIWSILMRDRVSDRISI